MNVEKNDKVLARCSDGIAYPGTVTQVDPIRLEVEIRFDDGDLMWARYADLRLTKSHRKLSSTERCRACLKDEGDLKV